MGVRFDWKWADDGGEYVRVMVFDGEQPDEGVEVCRMVPGKTDDRTGCVLRATNVCDALRLLASARVDRP